MEMKFISTLIIITSLFTSLPSLGAQDAVIRVRQAIVYADTDLSSPIGYIRKDRKIRVGEKARRKGTIYPVIVSGRIAWIMAQDLYLLKDLPKKNQRELEARWYD